MLDDFRQQAEDSFLDEPEALPTRPALPARRFLGMTPVQTFIVVLILFFLTCLLSTSCLLATGRVMPPFL
jgi:hypothetical protein